MATSALTNSTETLPSTAPPHLQVGHELLEGKLEGALPVVDPCTEREEGVLCLGSGFSDLQDEHGLRKKNDQKKRGATARDIFRIQRIYVRNTRMHRW